MAQLPKGGLVRSYDKPIHWSCAIYFPGGIGGFFVASPKWNSANRIKIYIKITSKLHSIIYIYIYAWEVSSNTIQNSVSILCDQPKKLCLQPRMLLLTAGIKSSWNGPQKTTRLGIFPFLRLRDYK